jgi:peptidyl-prolyl cis-trans isomerase SurA
VLALGTAPVLAQGKPSHTKLATAEAAPPAPTPSISEADVTDDSVAAVVNDDIVTEYDLRQRLALVLATSGVPPTAEAVKKL